MVRFDSRFAVVAVLLGGIAWIAPTFLSGPTSLGSGSYGGTMGSHGGMMGGYGGMMGGSGGLGTGWIAIGLITQVGFFLVLLGGAYLLYRAFVTNEGADRVGTEDGALAELRVGYARGDVSDEEFVTRRENLRREGVE